MNDKDNDVYSKYVCIHKFKKWKPHFFGTVVDTHCKSISQFERECKTT